MIRKSELQMRFLTFFGVIGLGAISVLTAHAETPEEKGLAIAKEIERRNTGFQDESSELTMKLYNKNGEESIRYLRMRTLEVSADGDKSLVIFDRPADVKGTALLTFSHALAPDEQWVFLPALKRVKRISSENKSGPFMGSEFAYEDFSSQDIEKYTYKYLRDEVVEGKNCFVVERYPAYENSGYTRQMAWIDPKEYRPERIDYYDRKNQLLKTQTFLDYKKYLDQYWRPHRMQMINHQTEKKTVLEVSNYKFRSGLTDRDFDRNSLENAR